MDGSGNSRLQHGEDSDFEALYLPLLLWFYPQAARAKGLRVKSRFGALVTDVESGHGELSHIHSHHLWCFHKEKHTAHSNPCQHSDGNPDEGGTLKKVA